MSSTEAETKALPVLDRYVVFDRLATGGMASIYLAQRRGLDRVCIIKVLHDHLAKDPVVGNRFLREAQVAALLDHPHIARLTDAGWDRGQFYLAMEYIAGQDLETMMFKLMEQRRMLPPELSATVGLQVLDGLAYAHDYRDSEGQHLQIVHRDLSPRNVMVTYDGGVKIIDFGLARTNLGDFRTAPGMVLGTLRYMSPEQAVAEPVDRRSDLYSWSVVLYEALSGRPLVMGANAQEILHMVVTQTPSPITDRNPNLPRALDAVFARALAKSREERFPSARALREALAAAAPNLFAPAEAIGEFVSGMYGAEKAKAEETLARAQAGEYTQEPTRVGDAPEFEATRAGVPTSAAAEVGPAFEPTRFGLPAPTPTRAASTLILDSASNPDASRSRPDPAASWGSVNVRPVRPGPRPVTIAALAAALLLALSALGYAYLQQAEAPSVPVATAPRTEAPRAEVASPAVAQRRSVEPEEKITPSPEPSAPIDAASKARRRPTPSRTESSGSPSAPAAERPAADRSKPSPEDGPGEVSAAAVERCRETLKTDEAKLEIKTCIENQRRTILGDPQFEGCLERCRSKKAAGL